MDAGLLEICRFLPPALLPADLEELDFDEFFRLLGKARYMQKLEVNLIARGIAEAFKEE